MRIKAWIGLNTWYGETGWEHSWIRTNMKEDRSHTCRTGSWLMCMCEHIYPMTRFDLHFFFRYLNGTNSVLRKSKNSNNCTIWYVTTATFFVQKNRLIKKLDNKREKKKTFFPRLTNTWKFIRIFGKIPKFGSHFWSNCPAASLADNGYRHELQTFWY